jgi:hypothetical protein
MPKIVNEDATVDDVNWSDTLFLGERVIRLAKAGEK